MAAAILFVAGHTRPAAAADVFVAPSISPEAREFLERMPQRPALQASAEVGRFLERRLTASR
jgi:hypothetical protein